MHIRPMANAQAMQLIAPKRYRAHIFHVENGKGVGHSILVNARTRWGARRKAQKRIREGWIVDGVFKVES